MKLLDIAEMPEFVEAGNAYRTHESVLRAYHIVERVKSLLEQGTPGSVVLELIELMENCPRCNRRCREDGEEVQTPPESDPGLVRCVACPHQMRLHMATGCSICECRVW